MIPGRGRAKSQGTQVVQELGKRFLSGKGPYSEGCTRVIFPWCDGGGVAFYA